MRQALPNSVLLTTDIVAGNWYGPQYLVELQEHVDYVNLMAFDFTGAWSNSPIGYHSELPLFKLAIQHTLQRGFSAEKLLISLPAYGIEFKDGKTETAEHVLYKDIVEQLNRDPAALAKRQAGHLYFETASDIANKVKYIDSEGLAGITFFQLWGDHPDPEFNLLQHINAQWISPAITADSTEK